jgi:hypothetical protein
LTKFARRLEMKNADVKRTKMNGHIVVVAWRVGGRGAYGDAFTSKVMRMDLYEQASGDIEER